MVATQDRLHFKVGEVADRRGRDHTRGPEIAKTNGRRQREYLASVGDQSRGRLAGGDATLIVPVYDLAVPYEVGNQQTENVVHFVRDKHIAGHIYGDLFHVSVR
jgi:hypothetical protein